MSTLRPILGGLTQPTAFRLTSGSSTGILLQRDGYLVMIDLSTGQARYIGKGPVGARKLDLDKTGQIVYIVGGQPGLWQFEPGSGKSAKVVARGSLFSAIHVNSDTDTVLVTESRFNSRLLAIALSQIRPKSSILATGLRAPRALLRQRTTGIVYVADAARGGQLLAVVKGRRPEVIATGIGSPVDMAWRDAAQTQLLLADIAAGRILQTDLTQPAAPPEVLFSNLTGLYAVQALNPDELIIGADEAILHGDLIPFIPPPVELHFPDTPLFVAGWVRVQVIINDPAINFDDLEFFITPEKSAAMVSNARDNGFDPSHPEIMVSAGWMTGEHRLNCVHRPTGNQLIDVRFEVTDTWPDDAEGPTLSVLGSIEAGPTAGTWGGGDFTTPQNNAVVPALGTRNVAVVLVDTADARYPAGAALTTILNNFQNEMVNGVTVNGQNRSAATYYNQASNGAFSLNISAVVGPVSLPGNWGAYFNGVPQVDAAGNPWTQWLYNNAFAATVIANIVTLNDNATAAGNPPFLDLSTIDSIVITVRTVPAAGAAQARFAWPMANLGPRTHIIGHINLGFITLPIYRAIAAIVMPDDWAARPQSLGRQWHDTVVHELGHNLQLNDQYFQTGTHDPIYQPRIADDLPNNSWELMSWEENLPLPSAAHRLMLGWLDPDWIKLFNFGVFGPVDETFTLHAASAGTPPPGEYIAAEIRIADGRNYYFEYRPPTLGRIVDANPPTGLTVFATDVTSRGATPANRPEILRLRDDADIDHSEFQLGDDYEEVDTTLPQFPNDLVIDVLNTTNDTATLRVRYGQDQEPDPAITPWSASTNWQSPDIEVRNARSLADPTYQNIPWEGHDNTVIARVTNRGQIPALGVRVRFGAKDFTFSGGAESSLGDQVDDVNTGATVSFTAPVLWRPAQLNVPFLEFHYKQHACLVARIDPYIRGALVEVTPDNNEAQSNYTWMASTTSSPATRELMIINAHNPLPVPAYVNFEVWQPHPLFRVYLSHRWVRLEPDATAPIIIMVESLLGAPEFAPIVEKFSQQEKRIMTTLRLSALGETGETCTSTVLGGISILVLTGRATRFEKFEANEQVARGKIVAVDTDEGIDGSVLISIRPRDPADKRSESTLEAVARAGAFGIELAMSEELLKDTIVQAHYLGDFRFTPSDSVEIGL